MDQSPYLEKQYLILIFNFSDEQVQLIIHSKFFLIGQFPFLLAKILNLRGQTFKFNRMKMPTIFKSENQ